MHVLRYILLAAVAVVPVTWLGIELFPRTGFVQYVPKAIGAAVVALAILTALALWTEDQATETLKRVLMGLFLLVILGTSLFAASAYVHQVSTSWSNGEVHYHADYEVIVQDSEGYHQLDLIDPSDFCEQTEHESTYMCRLNDRTGAVEYHEHNDRRIHLEGTFREREDATLATFFQLFGGELSNTRLVYPTNEKTWTVEEDGDRTLKIILERGVGGDRGWCGIGPAETVPAEDVCIDFYTAGPARSPAEYVISPFQTGPPLDDIWIIYDDASFQEALQDLRDDGAYKQFTQEKTAGAEGY